MKEVHRANETLFPAGDSRDRPACLLRGRAGRGIRHIREPACDIPDVRIQFLADVKKVKVGVTEDTCNLVVKELMMNDKPFPTPNDHSPPTSASGAATSQAGWEWYIESLAKVVGVGSIDDLTKT